MHKQNLTKASRELFRRRPDERFATLQDLWRHCTEDKERSVDRWHPPCEIEARPTDGPLRLALRDDSFALNDWSFSQLCRLAGVAKDTLNKLSADTASRVLSETLPCQGKPLQAWTSKDLVRSIHGAAYTRLFNADLLAVVAEFATDFQPPPEGANGGTGLYCGEQDLFAFLIDPTGWAEIEGEAFAPGFFLWNSEVGRRSVGIQTFWFQAVCQNHIVWDAVEVIDFSRKHTANVHECLSTIRSHIEALVKKRDDRRDGFARVMKRAFTQRLGDDAEGVAKELFRHGVPRDIGGRAVELAAEGCRFTVFSLVDALTRLSRGYENAGERSELDEKAGRLLALAA